MFFLFVLIYTFMENGETKIEEITKESVVLEIRKYVVDEYIDSFDGEALKKVSVSEFLKAQDAICKLMGFDKADGGEVLPDTIELLLP